MLCKCLSVGQCRRPFDALCYYSTAEARTCIEDLSKHIATLLISSFVLFTTLSRASKRHRSALARRKSHGIQKRKTDPIRP